MAWSTSFDKPSAEEERDNLIIEEAHKRFKICQDWEAQARTWFEYDYKFANADSNNMYQWDNWVVGDRIANQRPCLTINKTAQHNLQIINDGKQNKPGVNIRPVGDEATFEAAQIYQELVHHIEYISNAESVYDYASKFQVDAGWGYWRVNVKPVDNKSFDKEIYINRIKDPRSVYMDMDINEADGSDARFGFIFDDMPKDLYELAYPKYKNVGNSAVFSSTGDGWYTKDHVRVCEYYRKNQEEDKLVAFTTPLSEEQVVSYWSELDADGRETFNEIKRREGNLSISDRTYRERDVIKDEIEWFKIAGNCIIERAPWLGKYIPIVRLVGTETIIDGVWDCKGHTRALLDPQRIYNINSSANVEFGALQSKSPISAPVAAIEGLEEYYKTANTVNHAVLPWNHVDEDGNAIPSPKRMEAPQASPAYVEQMKIAQNEMMMVSGQFQAQFGEAENAKSGVAINARQRQGDRATYHFIDNQAIAIRFTGKIIIDLVPKIYDVERVKRIQAKDGTVMNVTIDPNAPQAVQKVQKPDGEQQTDNSEIIHEIIFNPNIGTYDVQSDTGPSFATRRQEAFNALTQIAAQNKEFMGIAGDILWKVADFPEAQVLAQRWRKVIPPNILGDAPNPQVEQAMKEAADKIEQQLALITKQQQEISSKDREIAIKERDIDLREKEVAVAQQRLDYEAETKRLAALGNSGPALTVEQIQPIVIQLIRGMLAQGEPGTDDVPLPGPLEGGTPLGSLEQPQGSSPEPEAEMQSMEQEAAARPQGMPPDARQAPDGQWYVENPDAPGQFLMVDTSDS